MINQKEIPSIFPNTKQKSYTKGKNRWTFCCVALYEAYMIVEMFWTSFYLLLKVYCTNKVILASEKWSSFAVTMFF